MVAYEKFKLLDIQENWRHLAISQTTKDTCDIYWIVNRRGPKATIINAESETFDILEYIRNFGCSFRMLIHQICKGVKQGIQLACLLGMSV